MPTTESTDSASAPSRQDRLDLGSQSLQQEFHRLLNQPNVDENKRAEGLASIIVHTADKAFQEPDLKSSFRDFAFLRNEIMELKEKPEQLKAVSQKLQAFEKTGDRTLPSVQIDKGANGDAQYLYFHLTPQEIRSGNFDEYFELAL